LRRQQRSFHTDAKKELTQDHEDHQALLRDLANSIDANEPGAELRRRWLAFEENLLDHLDTEERALFSVAVQAYRLEIERLRTEHRQIRQVAVGLGVAAELHSLKRPAVDELRDMLRAHNEHEERSLHRWLAEDEGVLARRGVLAIRSRRERSSARIRVAAKVGD